MTASEQGSAVPVMFSGEDELGGVVQMLALSAPTAGAPYERSPVEVNIWRAKRAAVLLTDYEAGAQCEPVTQVLTDVLCDLMHLADAIGMTFEALVRSAEGSYEDETRSY